MTQALNAEQAKPRRRDRSARTTGMRQLPFARIRNPYRPVELMSADQIEQMTSPIHRPHPEEPAEGGRLEGWATGNDLAGGRPSRRHAHAQAAHPSRRAATDVG